MATSSEGNGNTPVDFVLLGPTGFLGSAILESLQKQGYQVVSSRVRLQDRVGIERVLDDAQPTLGVICAAGERGRPNVKWCDTHPVETMDANITGQLGVAAACHARGLHVVILGTGAFYAPDTEQPDRRFTEADPPNAAVGVYYSLRVQMEHLLAHFDNALVLRVSYPISSDLDPRGLLGKLARFERVDRIETSVTILEDLCPLIPEMAKRRATGVLNFVNSGKISFAQVIDDLSKQAPPDWPAPRVASPDSLRPGAELDVTRLAAASGATVKDASTTVKQIIGTLDHGNFQELIRGKL